MRKLLVALAAVLAASTASAAEGQIGLGALVGPGTINVTVPVNIAPGLRIEPFIGFFRHKETDSTNPLGDVVTTNSRFNIGTGVFVVKEAAPSVELIGGGRIGLSFISDKFENDIPPATSGSDSFMGFQIAAVGGAEYYLSPRFALGVEAELGLETEETAVDVRDTDIFTATFVTAKVFFK